MAIAELDRLASPDEAVELTILMPCLDEAETLARCIRKAQAFLEAASITGEVLVADNGSRDGSPAIATASGARVVLVGERGYGSAIYQGSLAARGKYIVVGDADDSYDFLHLEGFMAHLRDGAELVVGDRFAGGIAPQAMPWKNRYLGNPVLSTLGRFLFGCPVHDLQCGLRGYSADAFRRMDLQTGGMEFAAEMIIKSTLLRMRVAEVPTTLSQDGRSRPPHLRPWRDGWRHLRFLLLLSPAWMLLAPGLMLAIVGALVIAWLMPHSRQIGSVAFDVHTILYAAGAVIAGVQLILFGIFARVFASAARLLPESPRQKRLLSLFRLEYGAITGGVLILIGLALCVKSLGVWKDHSFGPLNPSATLRIAIPSLLAMALGVQTLFASFVVGVWHLPSRFR
jgi:glycosyltransferase involved in cell wall biosynthesis